jgi:hypothetical protein
VNACTNSEPVIPQLPDAISKQESQEIAYEYVRNSPTFVFDGIDETLKLINTLTISIPEAWTHVFQFDSRHAGYGDREGQVLAQVITSHEVSITVEKGEVVYASIDNKWDMLNQEELINNVAPSDGVFGGEIDITGSITEIELINSETVDGRILVELEEPNNTSDKFWVTIEKDTPVYEYYRNEQITITISLLTRGQTVAVWFKGAVAESYPAQVKANQVVVLK